MEYYLRQIDRGNPNPVIIDLKEDQIILGRRGNGELLKKYIQISRQHARLIKKNDSWYVQDLGSLNGVFVNGNRLGQEGQKLEIGDHIGLGISVPGADPNGFICTLSARPKRQIIVVDLCDDPPPIKIKTEPPDDTVSSSQRDDNSAISSNVDTSVPQVLNGLDTSREPVFDFSDIQRPDCSDNQKVVSNISGNVSESSIANEIEKVHDRIIIKFAAASNSIEQFSLTNKASTERVNNLNPPNRLGILGEEPHLNIKKSPVVVSNCLDSSHEIPVSESHGANDVSLKALHNRDQNKPVKMESNTVSSKVQKNDQQQICGNSALPLSNHVEDEIKACHVSLVRFDSEAFKMPPDVTKVFTTPDEQVIRTIPAKTIHSAKRKKYISHKRKKIETPKLTSNQDFDNEPNVSKFSFNLKEQYSSSHQNMKTNLNAINFVNAPHNDCKSSTNIPNNSILRPLINFNDESKNENATVISSESSKMKSAICSEPMAIDTDNNLSHFSAEKATNDDVAMDVVSNDACYSQIEEVITISDDEAYLDFNSSQLIIKEEPIDYDEIDNNIEDVFNSDFVSNVSDLKGSGKSSPSGSSAVSESIDSIIKFVQTTPSTSEINVVKPVDKTPISEQNVDIDFFPMSQFYDDSDNDKDLKPSDNATTPVTKITTEVSEASENAASLKQPVSNRQRSNSDSDSSVSSHDSIIMPSEKKMVLEQPKKVQDIELMEKSKGVSKGKQLPKSTGRAMLIEPQRMARRPSRICGREEWFEDRTSEHIPAAPLVEPKQPKKTSKPSPQAKKSPKGSQRTLIHRQSLMSKLESPKSRSKNAATRHCARKGRPSPRVSSTNSTPRTEPKKESSDSKKKNPPISRLPNEYASRSAFLLSDMQPVNATRRPISRNKDERKSNGQVSRRLSQHAISNKDNNASFPVTSNKRAVHGNASLSTVLKPKEINPSVHVQLGNMNQSTNAMATKVRPSVPVALFRTAVNRTTTFTSTKVNPQFHMPASSRDPRLQRRPMPSCNNGLASEHSKPIINSGTVVQNHPSILNVPVVTLTNANTTQFPVMSSAVTNNMILRPRNNNLSISNHRNQVPQMANMNTSSNMQHISRHNSSTSNQYPVRPFTHQPSASVSQHKPLENYRSNSQVCSMFMIKRIVELNVKWLEEQQKFDKPPSVVSAGAGKLKLSFNSPDDYISSYFPMLMLEVWDLMYQESKPVFENKNRVVNKFYFVVISSKSKSEISIYNCESWVNTLSFSPSEGNVVIMDIFDKNTKRCNPVFGYVYSHRIEEHGSETVSPEWKKVGQMWLENAKLWRFSVYTKKRPLLPEFRSVMKGNGICSVRNRVRLADALKSLESSPLCKLILKPNENDFFVKYSNVSPERDFSYSQKMLIEGITGEVLKQDEKPKIILAQGPPGTGKTRTIVGLLDQLVKHSKIKILVTAPSNAAIDEIGMRLLELNNRSSYRGQPIRFVRVGMPDQINRDLKPFTLDEKAAKLYKDDNMKSSKYKEDEIKKLDLEIDALKKQKFDYRVEKKLKNLSDQRKQVKEQLGSRNTDYGVLRNFKLKTLRESNIVLSTLGSCAQTILTSFFKRNAEHSFACCIIDEASQCTETEALLPLTFGINKLIMVGDHKQLPATVYSKLASTYGYERSMFERFHLYFTQFCNYNPIFMLTEQFRMHSEICHFPSKYFYDNRLTTAPHTDIHYESFPFHPFIVYDILDSQESDASSSKTNSNEALAIVNICSQLLTLASHISIGIITPYQAQRSLYAKSLGHNPKYKRIEVNTVDGFQGREKDIIILSCVRANSNCGGIGFLSCQKRLNVAITRARKCLIICVHSNTLMQSEHWRELIQDARDRHLCKAVASYKDVQSIFNTTMIKHK